jgi:hypothetical protein
LQKWSAQQSCQSNIRKKRNQPCNQWWQLGKYRKIIKSLNQNMMKKNMGKVDKMMRIIVAMVIGLLYFNNTISGMLGMILLVLAMVFLLTSLINFCPLYLPFGIDTREENE